LRGAIAATQARSIQTGRPSAANNEDDMPGAVPFGSEFLVNTTTADRQDDPTITALADGRFVVAWTDWSASGGDTSSFAVRAQVFNADGSKSGAEFLVNTTTAAGQSEPTITALPDGRFVVAWQDFSQSGGDTSSFAVRAQAFNADGSPSGSELLVNATTTNSQFEPTITALADGRFVVAWEDNSQSGGDTSFTAVRAQVFNADGSKSGAELQVNTTTASEQFEPTITALPDGRFVVAWVDNSQSADDPSSWAVRAQVFNADGSKSGAEFLVNTTTTSDQSDPTITALADGRFVVAWVDNSQSGGDTSLHAVRAQVFNADGSKAGAEFLVNTTTTFQQFDPTITALADGRFVVAWRDNSQSGGDTSDSAVRAQVFNADGSKSGAEFLVNTTTASSQFDPTITALPDGRFVVAWVDNSQSGGDTSLVAIRGQIFDPREAGINLSGTALDDDFVGTGFDDVIDGGAGDDTIEGGDGNDTLRGRDGSDTLDGGDGNDTYIVDDSDTLVIETGGGNDTDTVKADADYTLSPTASIELLRTFGSGTTDDIDLTGNNLDNTLAGNAADNELTGKAGYDRLLGYDGSDTLDGGGGNDVLTGGLGRDFMTGGTGFDRFGFDSIEEIGQGATRDVIRDFQHGADVMDLFTIDANGSEAGNTSFRFLAQEGAAFTGVAGQLHWFQQNVAGAANDKTIVEGDIDGDRRADFQIQLTGLKTLTAVDFIL
jgi:Ca2+-binding RTX toxin-like protein